MPDDRTTLTAARASPLNVLGWAAYLACSWTWCIGMFLPVLLVRDYGIWGFVVFAVPNVLGAAAMGWVLRDGASERIVKNHVAAIEAFRIVTVVFQLWFLLVYVAPPSYRFGMLLWGYHWPLILAAALAGVALAWRHWLAIVAWGFSIACAAIAAWDNAFFMPPSNPLWEERAPGAVLWLAPICAFGFALGPYLDPTFLRARMALRHRQAAMVFSIGFGVLFLAMIVFSLLYACTIFPYTFSDSRMTSYAIMAIAGHMILQLTYTCTVHARAAAARPAWTLTRTAWWTLAAIVAALVTLAFSTGAGFVPTFGIEEEVYYSFLAFYGLVFPAYVWLCMIPFPGAATRIGDPPQRAPSRRTMRVFWMTVGIAAPFYWLGFIERQEIWLVPGLLIVLLARFFARPREQAIGSGRGMTAA